MAKITIGSIVDGGGGGIFPNPTSGVVPVNDGGLFADSVIASSTNIGNGTQMGISDPDELITLTSGGSQISVDGVTDVVGITGVNGTYVNGGFFIVNHLGFPILRFLSNGASDPALKANGTTLEIRNGNDNSYMPLKARTLTAENDVIAGTNVTAFGNFVFNAKSIIASAIDGIITLLNNAQNNFSRLNFGGVTSAFPAIKRNGADLNVRLADDSTDANLTAKDLTASGAVYSSGSFVATAKSIIESIVNSNITLYNQAKTAFNLLQFGGVTSAFPAIKRNGTGIEIRLADDSNYADFRANTLRTEGDFVSTNVLMGFRPAGGTTLKMGLHNTFGLNVNLSGYTNNNGSAIVQIDSTTKGVLFPRMTALNRTAIASPATGLMVYQTDAPEGIWTYKSTGWVQGV